MKKLFGLDLIRTFAVVFVLCVHFFLNTNFYKVPFEGHNLLFQASLRWLVIICIPLFLMLSGYLLTQKKLRLDHYKDIFPFLGIYVLYSTVAILVRSFYFDEQQPLEVWIRDIIIFKANGYSWYVNMYIGLFLLMPFLNIVFDNLKNQREHNILIFTMIFITVLPGYFENHPYHFFPDWWINIYPLTYYCIGAYIRQYQIKINKLLAATLFIGIIMIDTAISAYFSAGRNFFNAVGDYCSILILAQAVLFFLIFYDIKISNKFISKMVGFISIMSLDIYLLSYVTDMVVYDYAMKNIYETQQQILHYFVVIVMTSFAMSVAGAFIRYEINKIRILYKNRSN